MRIRCALLTLLLGVVAADRAGAVLELELAVTPSVGAFDYAVRVQNGLAFDIVLINLVDAPAGDGLIGASAAAPSGYGISYDAGLGIVDLLEGASLFAAGGGVEGFSFTSQSPPGPGVFERFEAYTTEAGFVSGEVTLVPEPGVLALLLAGCAGLLALSARRRRSSAVALALAGAALLQGPSLARAASHSDAPLIAQDPQANITDVYAFVGTRYNDPNEKVLNVLTSYHPFAEPGDSPHFHRFSDNALYSIHLTDITTGSTVLRYDFAFSSANPTDPPGLKNADTIFSLGDALGTPPSIENLNDAAHNYVQTYRVTRVTASDSVTHEGGTVAPANAGLRTTPHYNDPQTGLAVSGATRFDELDRYTQQAIWDVTTGETLFAGPRDDGFYADIAGLYDQFTPRVFVPGELGMGQVGGGPDTFKGFNVLAIGMQIPIKSLSDIPGFPAVGVYTSVSRPRIRILRSGSGEVNAGQFIQTNRMGQPLFNEALVALKDKDDYNRMSPTSDMDRFSSYAEEPELARLLNALLGLQIPTQNRERLRNIYIPDVLKVDTSTPPARLPGDPDFSRLAGAGGDKLDSPTFGEVDGGFPNGRRIGDDVIDLLFIAIARDVLSGFFGDNVLANDQLFHRVFPYLPTPHAGPKHEHFECPPDT